MLLSILWTFSREKVLPQRELGPMFQPDLCRWLKTTNHQLREQNHAGCEWAGIWLLQLPLQRLRVPRGRFWVMQSRGAVSTSPWSHRPWITAWVDCPLLAPPRASAGPCWTSCLEGTLMLLASLRDSAFFYSLVWRSGLPHSFSKVGVECSGLNLCDLTHLLFSWAHFLFPFCHFVNQFYTWVIWKWCEKQSQWREGHASGSIYRAVHLLKPTLFAQVFKFFGAGTISLHRSE